MHIHILTFTHIHMYIHIFVYIYVYDMYVYSVYLTYFYPEEELHLKALELRGPGARAILRPMFFSASHYSGDRLEAKSGGTRMWTPKVQET